ncbi:MAG: glucose-1-phosphate adenylyltransferase [Clostridia bacterium]|nr:glucose-1-phosphate adenylyltransferase [Clostridia bacterium]MDE6211421.1 glucose-1-phosphate adenylyltransferase [Clostridia bacterium]MDE6606102.1 glucose-1-phosphate adenylyltransferase [Clostridia bacterium]MDE6870181.1 glucose-1-phosphate adenylyltransferase [Clostridia bacterium]
MHTNKKECVAMLLAGGQGTRLYSLTRDLAKPAVSFGGKYRIIDFPLSNCINSNIDTIGVLTQYKPFDLNQYIGNGQPWDLDRLNGGVFVLPPYMKGETSDWYKGTANAIYQNIEFVDKFSPEYVLILSGDHIYKMDYAQMLAYHKEKGADCTIAVINVSLEEASRFGIMNTNEDNSVYEFAEKPKHPKSTNASMGIYIFNWAKLRKYLIEDEEDKTSQNDFGKNIIPKMLADGQKLFAYNFSGYWKDVGTISSLWEANMDVLNTSSGINLDDSAWKIYARNTAEPPHYVGKNAVISNSLITEGCEINGKVVNSVLSTGVEICEGATVEDSTIMPGAKICKGAVVKYSIVGNNAVVGENAVVGDTQDSMVDGQWQITVVGPNAKVAANQVVPVKAMVD